MTPGTRPSRALEKATKPPNGAQKLGQLSHLKNEECPYTGPQGREQPGETSIKRHETAGALQKVASQAPCPNGDRDLEAVVTAWPTLPEAIRAGILAMVRSIGDATAKAP